MRSNVDTRSTINIDVVVNIIQSEVNVGKI